MDQFSDERVPMDRLDFFRSQLSLGAEDAVRLSAWREIFAGHGRELAEHLFACFDAIDQARHHLEVDTSPERKKRVWDKWFRNLWASPLDDELTARLWRIGRRHARLGVDLRFVSLAYTLVRRFCHDLIQKKLSVAERFEAARILDGFLDFCLLVETDSYLIDAERCDNEIVMGVAHQIRNPLTIIGGGAMRLRRDAVTPEKVRETAGTILDEALRLERMVRNVGVFTQVLEARPVFESVDLCDVLSETLDAVSKEIHVPDVALDMNLTTPCTAEADPSLIRRLFYHLLQNAYEALDRNAPLLRISCSTPLTSDRFVIVSVFNRGRVPDASQIAAFFEPFHSSKPYGAGFGLPIARMCARKCLGSLTLAPLPGEGLRADVVLPLPGALEASRLFAGS